MDGLVDGCREREREQNDAWVGERAGGRGSIQDKVNEEEEKLGNREIDATNETFRSQPTIF